MSATIPPEITAKTGEGHALESDPPAGMTAASRWTCKTCGDAVLEYNGNIYGGAVDRTCAESLVFWGGKA
jgi:hypothetical protein